MRWFNFAMVALVTVVLQAGVGRLLGLGAQRVAPDLLLLLAVIIAFQADAEDAPVACWFLGLLKDLTSPALLGSYAIGLGLVALAIVYLRELFYGQRVLVLMATVALAHLVVEHLMLLVLLVRGQAREMDYRAGWEGVLFSALLTAAVAPYGHWLIMKLHRLLGLPRRRSYRH